MDEVTDIIGLINSILPSVCDPEGIENYEPDSADFQQARLHRVTVSPSALSELTDELRKIDSIARLEGGIIHYSRTSHANPLKVESSAQWLLAQSRFRAPEACLDDLLAAVRTNASQLWEIVPIWGISPQRPFAIGNGLTVVPIQEIPRSRLKDLLTGKKRHQFSFDLPNSSARPGAAFVHETFDGPMYEGRDSRAAEKSHQRAELTLSALISPSEEAKRDALEQLAQMMDPLKAVRESTSIASLAEELAPVIALLAPKPIFTIGQWYQRPESTPLAGLLHSWSGPTAEHPFYFSIEKQEYQISEMEALVSQYQSLDDSTRQRLRTALTRLNQSRRYLEYHTVEAAAIDLGIAAEALLTQDRDPDAPISFLLRARGTLLLGGTPEARKQNYKVLRDLYNLRSKVAHTGVIADRATIPFSEETRRKLREATEQVKVGQRVCIEMLTAIIQRGGFPDWDALMLGWHPYS